MTEPAAAVLTDRDIRAAITCGDLTVDPFDPAMIRPGALGLRLGYEAFSLVSTGPVDIADRASHPELRPKPLDEQGRLVVEPGEVVLAPTLERVGLSCRLAALIGGTSSYARLGVSMVLSHQVSPGFGHDGGAIITLEITCHLRHPVLLHPGTRVANMMLFATTGSDVPYGAMPFNYSRDQRVVASRLADHVAHAHHAG